MSSVYHGLLTVSIFGQSHGPGIGVVVDGKGEGKASCKRPASGPWPVTVE